MEMQLENKLFCGDGGSRTPDLLTASQTLWPTELNPLKPLYKIN